MKKHTTIEALETRIAPATVFAVNDSNTLFSFDSETPGTLSAGIAISGLSVGQVIKTMDFNPANGELFGIAISGAAAPFTGQLYKINTTSGAATAAGAAFSTTLTTATGYDMEFDPTTGQIRVVNTDENNFRLNALGGNIASVNAALTGATSLNAIAHTNNYPGATSTTLYGVNFTNDDLMLLGGLNSNPLPDGGVATKVADINVTTAVNTQDRLGLDIHTTLEGNTAFYTGVVGAAQNLYTLNLATGAATLVGPIGGGTTPIFDIAVQPAAALAFPDGKSFTYTDGDGDLVTVKTSAGTLKSSQFGWLSSADGTRRELTVMNITSDVTFTGANLTITAKKTATGGDGRAEVGSIFANSVNLGAVKIGGNVEQFTAGTNDAVIPAVKSFEALSFGHVAGAPHRISNFSGPVPVFKVKTDISEAVVIINGKVGAFSIGGSLIGGEEDDTGLVRIDQGAKSVRIGGSIVGGDGSASGKLRLGPTGLLKIGGDIIGGDGNNSGNIDNQSTSTKTVIIGGSIVGGGGEFSGRLSFGGTIGTVKIGGSIIGGTFINSGVLNVFSSATAPIKNIAIGGSVVGGPGNRSGVCDIGNVLTMSIGGSIFGDSGGANTGVGLGGSGSVFVNNVGTFTLGGSIIAGDPHNAFNTFSWRLHFETAKSVLIKGSITGIQGIRSVIGFAGKSNPATVAESIAVGSLTIKGSVTNSEILIGQVFPLEVTRLDAAAGKISIGGDFLASSITAGINRGADTNFGTADDVPVAAGNANIKAAIASIVIKGRASGTGSDGDHYGIVAEQLGTVSIAGRKLALDPLAQDNQLVGPYADLRIRELAIGRD